MKVDRIFETCLYAADLVAAEQFYTEVLGLEVVSRSEGRGVAFRCGQGVLLVFDPERSRIPDGRLPPTGAVGAGHVAFPVLDGELTQWRLHLLRCGISIEAEVDRPEGRSLYFRDPAGNSVELAPPTLWGFKGEAS